MAATGFWQAGHKPTLLASFLYFDLAFMVWVILGPLGVQIAKDLQLDAGQKGLMVAVPVLSGALLRIVMGVLVDHLKPKLTGVIAQLLVIAALAWAWVAGIHTYGEVLFLGVLLGIAGASFAVALPLASPITPPHASWPFQPFCRVSQRVWQTDQRDAMSRSRHCHQHGMSPTRHRCPIARHA